MAIFKRKDKKQVTQLGKPIIKSTEVNQVSDVSKVQVVDTSQKASDIVPTGDIQKVIRKTTSSGGKSTLVTPTVSATVNQQETYVTQEVKQPETKREIRKETKQQVNLEKQRYRDLGYKTSQARKLARESIKQGGVTYTPDRTKEIIEEKSIKNRSKEILENLTGAKVVIPSEGTKIELPKTLDEIERENKLNKNILTANVEQLIGTSVKVEDITNNLERLSDKNEKIVKNINDIDKMMDKYNKYIEKDYFIGDETKLKEYNDLIKARNLELDKYNEVKGKYDIEVQRLQSVGGRIDSEGYIYEPTIGVGFFNERQEPISAFTGLGRSLSSPSTSIDIIGKSIFSTVGKGTEKGLNLFGLDTVIKEKQTTTYLPRQGTLGYGQSPYITENVLLPATTSSDVGNIVYKAGSGAVSFGKYLVPYVGTGLFVGEVISSAGGRGVVNYFKEKPIEAGITTTMVLTPLVSKGVSALTKVTGKEIEGGVRYSSRMQDWFGKRVRVSREGVNLLPSNKYVYQITREKIIPSESRELIFTVGRPQLQEVTGEKVVTYFDDILGTSREVKTGYKTTVREPDKVIFGKYNPLTKVGKLERKEAINYLKEKGYTDKQIKEILRLRQPKVVENLFTGKGQLIQGEKELFKLTGTLESKPILIEKQGIPSRLGQSKVKLIDSLTSPVKEEKGIDLFKSISTSREIKRGKDVIDIKLGIDLGVGASKKVEKLSELPTIREKLVKVKGREFRLEEEGVQFELLNKDYNVYKNIEISKKIFPKTRKVTESKSMVLVEKGEPVLRVEKSEESKIYDLFYHGTTEKQLPSILKEGLKPSSLTGETKGLSEKSLVSLGKTPEDVSGFATRSALRNRLKGIEDKPVILEVKLPKGQAKENQLISGIKEFNVLEVPKTNIKVFEKTNIVVPEKTLSSSLLSLEKIKLSKVKTKELPILKFEEESLPSMVGGKGGVTSEYFGQGIYETQELSSVSLPSVSSKSIIDIKPTQTELTKPKVTFGSKAKNILKDLIRPKEENRFIESSKSILGEVQVPRQQFRQLTKQDQALKLINLLKTSQVSKSKIKNIPIRTPKLKFKLDLPKIESKITRESKVDSFEVFVKKKGKEEFIDDSFKTLGEAKSRLSKELIGTLRASGGILKGGKKLEFEDIGLNEFEFRPSKSNKFLVVERKEKRLRRGGTGKQIQVFR